MFANTHLAPCLLSRDGCEEWPSWLMTRIRHHQGALALDFVRRLFITEPLRIPKWLSVEKTRSGMARPIHYVYIIDIPGVVGTGCVMDDVRAQALRTRTTADACWFWHAAQKRHVVVQSYPLMTANMYPKVTDHQDGCSCVWIALLDHPFRRLLHNLDRLFRAKQGSLLYPMQMLWARHHITNRKQFFQAPVMVCKQLLRNKLFASQVSYCVRQSHSSASTFAADIPVDCVRLESSLRAKLVKHTGCRSLAKTSHLETRSPPSLSSYETECIQLLYAEDFTFAPVFAKMFTTKTPHCVYIASGLQNGRYLSSFLLGEWLPLMMYLQTTIQRGNTKETCVVHIWRKMAVCPSSADEHQRHQHIYDDISAHYKHAVRFVIHNSTQPPFVDVPERVTYYEMQSFEQQNWFQIIGTPQESNLRTVCALLVKKSGAGMFGVNRNTHRRETLQWPVATAAHSHTHATGALQTLKWHEWLAILGNIKECVLPAPDVCKMHPTEQGFKDYSSLHWLLFLKPGTRVQWVSATGNWSRTKREWLRFLQAVLRIQIPQLPRIDTPQVAQTATDQTIPLRTSLHPLTTHRNTRKSHPPAPAHSLRQTQSTRSSVASSYTVPILPVLNTNNRKQHPKWHAYYESVYHHRVATTVDLNTFTWFYNHAPFEHPVTPRVRWSKVLPQCHPRRTSLAPDWVGETTLNVDLHRDRADRDRLLLQVNDAFVGHLPTPFPEGDTKPMNVVNLYGFFVKRTVMVSPATRQSDRLEILRIAEDASQAAWFWCVRGSGVFIDIAAYLNGQRLLWVRDRHELVKRFSKWLPKHVDASLNTNAGVCALDNKMPLLLRGHAGNATGIRGVLIERAHGVPELFVVDISTLPSGEQSTHAPPRQPHYHVQYNSKGQLSTVLYPPTTKNVAVTTSVGVNGSFLSTGDTTRCIRPVFTLVEERIITSVPFGASAVPPWLTHIQHECVQCLRKCSHNRTTDTDALHHWFEQHSAHQIRKVLNTWIPIHMKQRVPARKALRYIDYQYVDICCTPFGIAVVLGCPTTVLRMLLRHGANVHEPCPPLMEERLRRFVCHVDKRHSVRNRAERSTQTQRRTPSKKRDRRPTVSTYLLSIMSRVNTMSRRQKDMLMEWLRE
jgi:hypothetical protein